MSRRISIASTLVVLCGCQDYRFEQKCPETIKEQEIVRAAAEPLPADILFVVDNSGSMADEQANLAANFSAFINEIAGPQNDYRIAVVTTDTSAGNEADGRRQDNFETEPGTGVPALTSPNLQGCVATDIPTSCFRGPNANTRVIDSKQLDAAAQISTFQDNVQVGSCGSGDEEGLEAMIRALDKSGNGECNEGFLRDEANLVIVLVSDEDDGSDDNVAQYLEDLKRYKGVEKTRVAVIVGAADGEASNCAIGIGSECGSLCREMGPVDHTRVSCNSGNASAVCEMWEHCEGGECLSEPLDQWNSNPVACLSCSFFRADDCCAALSANRYVRFATMFEAELNRVDSAFAIHGCNAPVGERVACLIDSICQESFAATLQRIASDLVITSEFAITPPAEYPEGIRVRLSGGRFGDGVDLERGTDFRATATTVELLGNNVPGPGENVEVYYVSDVEDSSDNPRGACGI